MKSVMTARNTRLVVLAVFGLLTALASNCALGSIILDRPVAGGPFAADGILDASQGMAPAAPVVPPDKGADPLTIHQIEGLAPPGTAAGQPTSASQGGGTGPTNAALPNVISYLPDAAFRTPLPGAPRTIMPTGPPVELLRPPRVLPAKQV
jgi:hypothetical protein